MKGTIFDGEVVHSGKSGNLIKEDENRRFRYQCSRKSLFRAVPLIG